MLKADLHIHTEYSLDCSTPLQDIIDCCLKRGINCIAIADHGTIEGALKMQGIAPFPVIVAEEILTPHGEIMGMFLKEGIPSGISVNEAISRIKAQNGLVCIPHPYDTLRHSALGADILDNIVEQIDIVEVFNSRTILLRYSKQAQFFARKHGIPGGAGSDAHRTNEIGNAYVEMPEFTGRDDFLQALVKGKVCGKRTNPVLHFRSAWTKLKKRFRKGPRSRTGD